MKYCYQGSEKFGEHLLLGSIIRALGKGWSVEVRVHSEQMDLFKKFQMQLKKSAQIILTQSDAEQELRLVESDKKEHVIRLDDSPDLEEYDLISKIEQSSLKNKGVIAITGSGKGKTTLGLGFAAQAVANNQKAVVIQWFKEKKKGDLTWAINEHFFPDHLNKADSLQFFPMGLGFFGSPNMDRVKGENAYQQHRKKAYEGLDLAKRAINEGHYQVVVLDELIDTVKEIAQNIEFPLIDLVDLQNFFAWVVIQPVQIVVTGRRVAEEWKQFVSKSVVISEVKHPWSSKKQGATSGLDF